MRTIEFLLRNYMKLLIFLADNEEEPEGWYDA